MRKGDWISTFSGVQFWPLDARPEDVMVEDIAHSLSNQCRFSGHCSYFYSVAQHSVLVSEIVPDEDMAWALLHDASEAYLVDLPRPLKRGSQMGALYMEIEARLMAVICERFNLTPVMPASVHQADNTLLMTEKRDIMPNCKERWVEVNEPLVKHIEQWTPHWSKLQFLNRCEFIGIK